MRWTPGSRRNIEDRRGARATGARGAVPMGIGGLLLLLLLSWFTGVDFLSLVGGGGGGGSPAPYEQPAGTSGPIATSPEEEEMVDMVDAVVEDAQELWSRQVDGYQRTTTVLFRDAVDSTCGFAQSAVGPFYCPADRKMYLDLSFFNELHRRFGAPGDFAQAYVLAHEIGHHVQTVLGIERQVRQRQASSPASRNDLSVRMELQADCFAGVWGHLASQRGRAAQGKVELDPGDVEEALRAASAIGDDTIQRRSGGRVVPDSFTHGSSEQRVTWFRRGFESGDPNACDTFK